MVYHQVSLGPTEGQMSDLAQGLEVQLSPQHLAGDCVFLLTTAQVKRLQKAASKGKGCRLRLSASQVKKIAQKGSGRFTDFLRKGFELSKPLLAQGVDYGVDYAGKALKNKIKSATGLQQGKGFFGKLVRAVGNTGVDALSKLAGDGIDGMEEGVKVACRGRPRGRPRMNGMNGEMQGKGFLGKIVRSIGNVGVDALSKLAGDGMPPNPYANPNEGIQAALFQKKLLAPVSGRGLKM